MRVNMLFGGKAGEGANLLTNLVSDGLFQKGYFVFYSREYQSLIRGGHNYNIITFSDEPVFSNDSSIDVLVCFDDKTKEIHKKKLKKTSYVLENFKEKEADEKNMFIAGLLYNLLNLDFKFLEERIKDLRNAEKNLEYIKEGYSKQKEKLNFILPPVEPKKYKRIFSSGTEGFSAGALNSNLNFYYAYPMTPATSLMTDLAQKQKINKNINVIQLENEIAVINAAIGSSLSGKIAMVGSSGGGFDLMTESLSLSCQAGIPIVIYLASRPGPGTGVATSTLQGDLNLARHAGHGEAFRIVLAPGDFLEAEEITNLAFYFSYKYKLPSIILSDKHLAESFYTLNDCKIKNLRIKPVKMNKYNSYECDKNKTATEDTKIIKKNYEERIANFKKVSSKIEKFSCFKIYGEKQSKNLIISYGSTKGAILDAIKDLDVKFLQVLCLEPISKKIKKELEEAEKIILIENSSTGQLADLIREKTGILVNEKILKYNGKPFFADELKSEINKKLK